MLEIKNGTVIDAVSSVPRHDVSVWIEAGRIRAIGRPGSDDAVRGDAHETVDARGKFIIPGLMDANVHLLLDMRLENLAHYEGRYQDLIIEAAQVALKNGLTTVFDTWGPRKPLMAVRDRIAAGAVQGSRIYCAGNIVGLDGPISKDFLWRGLEVASTAMVNRINAMWSENVGPELSWMTADEVGQEVRAYIGTGIDFVKYASSEHRSGDPTTFLQFSPRAQAAIIAETHGQGLTVQAHTFSVESLRVSVEEGCDIIQHSNMTGPRPIPDETLELMATRQAYSTVFPFTQARLEKVMSMAGGHTRLFRSGDVNVLNLIKAGAPLLLGTDAGIMSPDAAGDPTFGKSWFVSGEENLGELGQGHFHWMKAMEEKGFPAFEILRAATRNIAVAYKKGKDLGTVEVGKIADLLILDANPLERAANYRRIHAVIKDGVVIDRSQLPQVPLLTRRDQHREYEGLVRRQTHSVGFPLCC